MTIIIQMIQTHWGKEARGHALASKRNLVVENYPLDTHFIDKGICLQQVIYSENNHFIKPVFKKTPNIGKKKLAIQGFELIIEDKILVIYYFGTPYQCCRFNRNWKYLKHARKKVACLKKNQWLRIIANSRSPYSYYSKYVTNIFFGNLLNAQDLINSSPPKIIYNIEGSLYFNRNY